MKSKKTTNGTFTYYDGKPEVNHTIEEKEYPEFFQYFQPLVDEVDDVLGGRMQNRNLWKVLNKDWDEIVSRMVTEMDYMIEEKLHRVDDEHIGTLRKKG